MLLSVRSLASLWSFRKQLISFVRPPGRPLFVVQDSNLAKLLTKIRVEFCDLRDHDTFNCISPTCRCGLEDEISVHYLLRCPLQVESIKYIRLTLRSTLEALLII